MLKKHIRIFPEDWLPPLIHLIHPIDCALSPQAGRPTRMMEVSGRLWTGGHGSWFYWFQSVWGHQRSLRRTKRCRVFDCIISEPGGDSARAK